MTVTTTHCGTCGLTHQHSPFGCPRWDPPLFDALTPAELDATIKLLAGASMEVESELLALERMDLRAQRNATITAMELYGQDAGTFRGMAEDAAALFAEAIGAQEVRA